MPDDTVLTDAEAADIIEEARERFKLAVSAEEKNRKLGLDDLKFLNGEQWDDAAIKARKNRPCLTINRLPTFVRQVVNEQRKTRPSIDVIPADSQASKPTADVLQGLVRHIERTSRAQIAYDTAFEYAVSCGIGHFKITTDYVDDETLDQEIRIERIANPFSVYRDPASQQPDHSDDRFTFITELTNVEDFEAKYGFRPMEREQAGTGDDVPLWFDGKDVRVAEYWRVVTDEETITVLGTGEAISGTLTKAQKDEITAAGMTIAGTRKTKKKTVEQYLLTYDKVIQRAEWKGQYIPVVTTTGGELNIDGETVLTSLIRDAKDPARMYNYMASAETEAIALQPKAPTVGAAGAFDNFVNDWTRANTEPIPFLEYNPVPGEPPPQRQQPPIFPAALREARMAAAEDIKAVTGMYDASMGAKSNETSGVAIRARAQEGDTATFHFIDNHARAIEQCGRIIIDLAPHIYDTPRVIRILGPTNDVQMAVINQTFIDPKTGQEMMHDLQQGRYDVAVRVGPSFESKRQEFVEAVVELANANPQLMQLAGDLVVKNMDWPDSELLAERLQKMLPPQVTGQPVPPPPEQALIQAQVEVEKIKGESAQAKSQADAQMKAMELQIAQQTYLIKQAELEIVRAEVAIKANETGNAQQLEQAKTAVEREKTAVEAMRVQNERMQLQLQAVTPQMGPDGAPLPLPDMSQMGMAMQPQHEQTMAAMTDLVVNIGALIRVLAAPKETKLITDGKGKPIGSVTQSVASAPAAPVQAPAPPTVQ